MRFQCSPYHINSALWVNIQNLERTLKFTRDESAETKLNKLESLIVDHFDLPLSDVRFMAAMLSIPYEERYGELTMTPQKFKEETLRTLVDLIVAAAKSQPTILLFEDAHWSDPSTLELLDLMVDRVKGVPLLILITHRPQFVNRWADHGHVTALNLSKLTGAESSALVAQVTRGKALPADLLEQILIKTDGVPLFVEELIRSILESGEILDQGDHYDYAGTSHRVTIPATLRGSLMARLDRHRLVREIAQIGAVIGREFSYELISAVSPAPVAELNLAAAQLAESGLAFRRGTPPDAVYTFKHALVWDAAYDSLLKSRRQILHRMTAQFIDARFPQIRQTEPEILAHHLTEADETLAAIQLWQQAGKLAQNRLAVSEAVSHLNKGLCLVKTLPAADERDASELELRLLLGPAYMMQKGYAAAEIWDCVHPTRALATRLRRNDLLTSIPILLQSNVMTQGRVAESLLIVQEMLETGNRTGDSDLLIWAHEAAANCYSWIGRFIESLEHSDIALALYDQEKRRHDNPDSIHNVEILARLVKIGPTWALGYPDRAVQLFDETVAVASEHAHPFELGYVLARGSEVFDYRGESEVQRQHIEAIERLGRDNNLPALWALYAPTRSGVAYIREGMAQLGDIDGVLQVIGESIEQVERPGWQERNYYAEILRLKGWMHRLKDDVKLAEISYQASLECARGQQAKSWELRTATSLARLWIQQGRHRDASGLLEPIYNWFTEGLETADLKQARSLLDSL